MDQDFNKYLKLLVKTAVAVLAMVGIYLLFTFVFPIFGMVLKTLPSYFMPFILAILFAFMIEPLIGFFELRLKFKRPLATIVSLLLSLGILFLVIFVLIAQLIMELIRLYEYITQQSGSIGETVMNTLQQLQLFYLRLNLPSDVEKSLQNNLSHVVGGVEKVVSGVANALMGFVSALPEFFIFLLITMVATFFIANEKDTMRSWFLNLFPDSWSGATRDIYRNIMSAFVGFLKAETILVSITGLQAIIGLKILGSEYALTVGLLTGLLDIMPVLGPGALFTPWIVWEFIRGNTGFAIGLTILYGLMVAVRYLLEPRIVGGSVGLHPLATLVSLYVGLKAGGVIGMFLGPILVILFLACKRAGVFDGFTWKKVE